MLTVQVVLLILGAQGVALVVLALPALRGSSERPVLRRLVAGASAVIGGLVLIALRGRIPDVASIVVANGLLLGGQRLLYRSVARLYRLVARRWDALVVPAGVACLVATWLLDGSPGHLTLARWRVLAVSAPLVVLSLSLLAQLRREAPRPWSLGTRYLTASVAGGAALHAVRAVAFAAMPVGSDPLKATGSSAGIAASLGLASVTSLMMMVGLLLEHEARVQARLRDANAGLLRDAMTDALTGLGNRRGFEVAAGVELSRARRHGWPVTVLLLDVDHFKRVNDRWGHPAGDAVLCEVARRCLAGLRTHDVLARWGGEEFALLLPHSDLAAAEVVARRMLGAVRAEGVEALDGERVTISVGAAAIEPGDASIAPALARADAALYEAKRQGRDRLVVDAGGPPGPRAA